MAKLSPIHPGEILAEEFLAPLGVTQYRLAVDMGMPPRRINEIVLGRRADSGERERQSMSAKVRYTDEPMGELRVIPDFLPPPEELFRQEGAVKVTISLSQRSRLSRSPTLAPQ